MVIQVVFKDLVAQIIFIKKKKKAEMEDRKWVE